MKSQPKFKVGQLAVFDRGKKRSIPVKILEVKEEPDDFFYRVDRKNFFQEAMLRQPNAEELGTDKVNQISVRVYQRDWVPGFAAFHDDGVLNETARAHVILNLGSLLAAVQEGDLEKKDLPYMVAESLMHEVIHVLEAWAGEEFSEDRVEALLMKYREKYKRDTIWEYTGKEPELTTTSKSVGK